MPENEAGMASEAAAEAEKNNVAIEDEEAVSVVVEKELATPITPELDGTKTLELTVPGLSTGSRYSVRVTAIAGSEDNPQSSEFTLVAETAPPAAAFPAGEAGEKSMVMVFVEASTSRTEEEDVGRKRKGSSLIIPINDPIRLLPIIGKYSARFRI